MKLPVRALGVAAALAIAAGGAGCATTQTPAVTAAVQPSPTQQFNDTDVQFAQQMIVHHLGAVMMARMAAGQAASPEVKQLAAQIGQEQAPEIEQMSAWLRQWGKPVPSMGPGMAMPSISPGVPMGPGMMPSMAAMPDMDQMQHMTGRQFDQMYLQAMIVHHQQAVEMAKAEIANGTNPAAKQLAEKIQVSQSAQIKQMRRMLGATPSPTS
jgi:uncharacterized protein (DUF305 family)